MASASRGRPRRHLDIWAGYVDVLSTLLMVIIFTLMVFVMGQFFLSQALSGRERKLAELSQQLSSLGDMLALQKASNSDLRDTIAQLTERLRQATEAEAGLKQQLSSTLSDRDALAAALAEAKAAASAAAGAAASAAAAAKAEAEAKLADAYKTIDVDQKKMQTLLGDLAVLESLRDELRKELEASQASNTQLTKSLADTQGTTVDLQTRLAASEQQIAALTAELNATKAASATLSQQLAASQSANDDLQKQLATSQGSIGQLQQQVTASQAETDEQKRLRAEAELQLEMLNQQLLSLRDQLARLTVALDASEAKAKADEVQIFDLGKRLNEALASKVEELARYRSEFFGKLKEVLGNRPDIQVVGDRFIFQSEVLFDTASAEIGEEGKLQLAAFADTLKTLAARIPPDIDWILRVDGHTDKQAYHGRFGNSNWELSTARAIAVVKFLIEQGIPANRLVAAGFAEFRPLDDADTDEAFRHNRRIELKLDQR
jgi:chemotaxis protein MotB